MTFCHKTDRFQFMAIVNTYAMSKQTTALSKLEKTMNINRRLVYSSGLIELN